MADPDRRPRPRRVGEHAQRRTRAAEQEHRPQHVEDHEEDQPGPAGVRPVEPGRPRLPLGRVADPDHREDAERDQRQHRDRVLQEPQHRPAADQRDVEAGVEQRPVRLEVDRRQDHEGPEREEVREARHGPPQQLALAEHLHQLRAQALAEMVLAVVGPLAGPDQPVEPVGPPPRDRERGHRHRQPDHEADHVHRVHPASPPAALQARVTGGRVHGPSSAPVLIPWGRLRRLSTAPCVTFPMHVRCVRVTCPSERPGEFYSPSSRAITMRWISEVPSPISSTFASR